jgi:hypothetical protein
VHLTAAEENRRSSTQATAMSDDEYFSDGSEGTYQDDSMSDAGNVEPFVGHAVQH